MWQLKTTTVLIIVQTLGMIKKGALGVVLQSYQAQRPIRTGGLRAG